MSKVLSKLEYLQRAQQHALTKGGQCLSTEYISAKTKMLWKCSNEGHEPWLSTSDQILGKNHWCKLCSKEKTFVKDGYDVVMNHAKSKGGFAILTGNNVQRHSIITWKCHDPEHKPWQSDFRNVVMMGTWCPYCAGRFSPEEYLEKARKYAASKVGTCLSTKYENQNTKLEFKCSDPHHPSWFSTYDKIVPFDAWCKQCRYISKQPVRDSYLEKAKRHAKSLGGECLSIQYKNSTTKLLWKCSDTSHKPWEATYANVVGTLKRWCSTCAGQFSPEEQLEKAKEYAQKKGGECLTEQYINNKTRLLWKCKDVSHKPWEALISNIMIQNTWCPQCGDQYYYKENNTRIILEFLLGFELKKAYPSWNMNPQTNFALELDGYNEEHGFAFEFQGRHHFEKNVFRNTNLEDIQLKDKIKKENCQKNNVLLLVVNDKKTIRSINALIDYIKGILIDQGIAFNHDCNSQELMKAIEEANKFTYKDEFLQKAQDYALSRGGQCLSSAYINYNTPLEWKCSEPKHSPWKACISIIDKSWCPSCSGRLTKYQFLQKAKDYAQNKGGQCLSEYVDRKTKMQWKCSNKEHPTWAAYLHDIVKANKWCKLCECK